MKSAFSGRHAVHFKLSPLSGPRRLIQQEIGTASESGGHERDLRAFERLLIGRRDDTGDCRAPGVYQHDDIAGRTAGHGKAFVKDTHRTFTNVFHI
jgi:hypothetical protein